MAKGGGHKEGRNRFLGEGKWGQEMSNLGGIRKWQKEEGTERGEVGFMERANEANKWKT
jgi:hypothetical protein